MFGRCPQNLAHITALGVARADAVGPVGECDISIDAMVNDNFNLSRETMNVTRLMVLRISDEPDIAETKRCHRLIVTQATWVIKAPFAYGISRHGINLVTKTKRLLPSC